MNNKDSLSDLHNVAIDVITMKNLASYKGLLVLSFTFLLTLNLSHLLFLIFLTFYFLDFATGIFASKIEAKKQGKEQLYWIESSKVFRGVVKFLVYLQIISLTLALQKMLLDSEFIIHSKLIPLSPLQLVLCVCIASEFISNLENAKRCGIDFIGNFTNFAKSIWNLIKAIKNN